MEIIEWITRQRWSDGQVQSHLRCISVFWTSPLAGITGQHQSCTDMDWSTTLAHYQA